MSLEIERLNGYMSNMQIIVLKQSGSSLSAFYVCTSEVEIFAHPLLCTRCCPYLILGNLHLKMSPLIWCLLCASHDLNWFTYQFKFLQQPYEWDVIFNHLQIEDEDTGAQSS